MPVKYIPYVPNTIEGQAILDNLTRTRRVLRYRDNERVYDRVRRGLPLYEVERIETVGSAPDNLVIRGECLSACAYLKDKGIEIDLVYIDPPFASGADYAKKIYLRRHPKKAREVAKHDEKLAAEIESGEGIDFEGLRAFEEKMYGDIWNKEDYLNWMYENLSAIKAVMTPTGSIYVHLDYHIVHYVKILMDEIFGEANFQTEIIWQRTYGAGSSKSISKKYPNNTDTILFYTRDEDFTFNKPYRPYSKAAIKRYDKVDEQGRRFKWANLRTYSRDKLEGRIQQGEARIHSGARDPVYKVYLNEDKGTLISNLWDDLAQLGTFSVERVDYATQKPEVLLERIISASSDKKMVVADFFGGGGVAANVSHDLGRRFIHVDVGLNSVQTTRDRLVLARAAFDCLDIKDGVSLFRNPQQTMDSLRALITGLTNEDTLGTFWEGAIHDSKLGMMPVFVPNLLDHTTKVLDIPLMNRVLREALPDLPEGVKQAIVYYVDIDDRKALDKFIKSENPTEIKIELRDLKQVLDEVVLNDNVKFKPNKVKGAFEIEITRFVSDRLQQKIDEYNQKKGLSDKSSLFDDENGDENEDEKSKPKKKAKFKPIEISDDRLELIELVSLDCTATKGQWHADAEIKIDKKGFVIRDGKKTKDFWDAKIQSKKKPLRMKVRNIAGDESILKL